MQRINPDVDIVLDILQAVLEVQTESSFTKSLLVQYQERGGLSKKQLEGLYGKASKIATIPSGKLATLEAIIRKKHTRHKSPLPEPEPEFEKDQVAGEMLEVVLGKFPQHKRALFLRSKYDNNEVLVSTEIAELKKFYSLALSR